MSQTTLGVARFYPRHQVQSMHHRIDWWANPMLVTARTKIRELSRLNATAAQCTLPQAQPFPCPAAHLFCGFWLNAHLLCLSRPDTIFGRCKLRANIKHHTPTCAFEFNYSLRQILQTTSIARHDLFRACRVQ